ncbi:bis-(molybdopterin)-oxotungsten bis-guanylyltransferase, putative [Geotalea daltonii FRC-32]|uniref:Probable molybdenum cofactor guanylyltransferase n=1 Tax=Geotalea daltonii (strain DSM 22248 / JCM 15807 / FRC-32) TaxID=316067 RepID=B9M614_GEODF|nr:molybdenum cofactor guanylyltransferase [Geotalea daltonii]ACM19995.1 bis-(molybdopterin)-oxotungsten bis-guanylyltransferase, putative [Geotalea daltonii FRC-32]
MNFIDLSNQSTNVTGVILAGGASSRMGSNKALLPYRGGRFIEAIHRQLARHFAEIIVVTNTPQQYSFLPCRTVCDLFPGMGALAGIHAGLFHSTTPAIFAVACDMPYLDDELIRYLTSRYNPAGVVIPESDGGLEPLHAVYGRGCLGGMEKSLAAGKKRVVSFFDGVPVEVVPAGLVACFDGGFNSFRNINTPADYFSLRGEQTVVHSSDNSSAISKRRE